MVPHPLLGVDRFADGAEQAQAGQVVLIRPLVAPLDEGADRRRGGIQGSDLVLLDDVPEPVLVGVLRHALEHDRRGAVDQGAVDDVAVAGDPADVGRAPVDVVGLEVEDVVMRERGTDCVTAGGVDDALGLGRGPRRVEDVEHVFGVDLDGLVVRRLAGDDVVPPDVTPLDHVDVVTRPPDDEDLLDRRRLGQRLVDHLLEGHGAAGPHRAVAGDQELGLGVVDAVPEGVGREAAEDHGVGGAEPGTGQHGHRQLGDHAHVDGHPVALGHPEGG